MATNNQLGTTLGITCSDGRATFGLMFGTTNFKRLGLLQAPSITAALPNNLENLVTKNKVTRLLIVVHTTIPECEGCGGLHAFDIIKTGGVLSNDRLAKWLKDHVKSSDPYEHAYDLGTQAANLVEPEIEIAVCVFDHLTQKLYLTGSKTPNSPWQWISADQWHRRLMKAKGTSLHHSVAGKKIRQLLALNTGACQNSSLLATQFNFQERQSFTNLIFNFTPYAPDSVPEIAKHLKINTPQPKPDPYFCVYVADPDDAVVQMEYAYSHLQAKRLQDGSERQSTIVMIEDVAAFKKLINYLSKSKIFKDYAGNNWKFTLIPVFVDRPF